jgi:exosortase/archaeosortase
MIRAIAVIACIALVQGFAPAVKSPVVSRKVLKL